MRRLLKQLWPLYRSALAGAACVLALAAVQAAHGQSINMPTQINTGACLTGGPVINYGTIAAQALVNKQTGAAYSVQDSDRCALISFSNAAPVAITLPAPTATTFLNGWYTCVQDAGAGTATITPGGAATIDGSAAGIVFGTNTGMCIYSDGTNYVSLRGGAALGAGTVLSVGLTAPASAFQVSGSPVTLSGTLSVGFLTQSANKVLASGFTNGQAPTFRGLTAGDFLAAQQNLVFAGPSTSGTQSLTPSFRSLSNADMPNPTYPGKGGVKALAAVASRWVNALLTDGSLTVSGAAFSDLVGSSSCAQMPALVGNVTTAAGSCTTQIANGVIVNAMITDATITNGKLAAGPNATFKGNFTGAAAPMGDYTPTTLMDTFGNTQGNIPFRSGSAWTVLTPGISGQFVQSNGPNQNPSWAAVTGTFFSALAVRQFTTTATYTPTTGTKSIIVIATGAGGAGGSNTGLLLGGAGGGGAGATAIRMLTSGAIFPSVAITIGTGGVVGLPAGNGSTTSFGPLVEAAGGLGGAEGSGVSVVGSIGGLGASMTTNANFATPGGTGSPGGTGDGAATAGPSGLGGASFWGGGGANLNGKAWGAGGGGGTAGVPSGAGINGTIMVIEYQ